MKFNSILGLALLAANPALSAPMVQEDGDSRLNSSLAVVNPHSNRSDLASKSDRGLDRYHPLPPGSRGKSYVTEKLHQLHHDDKNCDDEDDEDDEDDDEDDDDEDDDDEDNDDDEDEDDDGNRPKWPL